MSAKQNVPVNSELTRDKKAVLQMESLSDQAGEQSINKSAPVGISGADKSTAYKSISEQRGIESDIVAQIKERYSLQDFLRDHGREKLRGRFHCIAHDDKDPSMSIKNNHWRCFSCGEHGDLFDAAKHLLGMDFKEAVQYLASRLGISIPDTPYRPRPVIDHNALLEAVALALINPVHACELSGTQIKPDTMPRAYQIAFKGAYLTQSIYATDVFSVLSETHLITTTEQSDRTLQKEVAEILRLAKELCLDRPLEEIQHHNQLRTLAWIRKDVGKTAVVTAAAESMVAA